MTDRLKGCTVVFDSDIREDDAEFILNAIRMIKGVLKVEGILNTSRDYIEQHRIRMELYEKITELLIL